METNQRNVVLQLGALITLYLSISFTLVILFAVIDKLLPSPIDAVWQIEQVNQNIRLGLAMVVVFFPTYLFLTRKIQRYRRQETGALYQTITKWLIYLSLLIGGLVLLGTLVTVIYNFLNGDLTLRFLLKAGGMVAILGLACFYYLKDAQGYWVKHEKLSIQVGAVAGTIVLALVSTGIALNDSPDMVRQMKMDTQQVQDLQSIQWSIENYLQVNSTTTPPETLEELTPYLAIPEAPDSRDNYEYVVTEEGFSLCATFAFSSANDQMNSPVYGPKDGLTIIGSRWDYEAGRYCFERQVVSR